MTKRVLLGFLLLISGFFFLFNKVKTVNSENLAVYVNNELVSSIPKKGEAIYIKSVCDNDAKATWDNETWGLLVTNMTKKTRCNLYFYQGDTVFNFDYTGSEQVFTVPVSGTYKLETWGAQGGNTNYSDNTSNVIRTGGYGGYSLGYIDLNYNSVFYINIGQKGASTISDTSKQNFECISSVTYNGGGSSAAYNCVDSAGSGGGATHIAKKTGLLSTFENSKSDLLIVSGGGGGSYSYREFAADGGSGGGFKGELPSTLNANGICGRNRTITFGTKSNQNSAGSTTGCELHDKNYGAFGIGESTIIHNYNGDSVSYDISFGSGGGGGYYGGGAGRTAYGAGGGSGYIGNSLLKDKVMYCYNCEESNEESTKTISTTCSEETPTENCAKKGNGYARITLISIDE